jgi:hypothetical protein
MARARSRKRRPTGARREPTHKPLKDKEPARPARVRSSPTAPTYGGRPRAPWHPLPISELLIFVGAIGAALGLSKLGHGLSSGAPALLAGLGAVALGTIEVSLREHRSGYRSHTTMLALMGVLVFDSIVVFGITSLTTVPRLFEVGLLALDIALFALLFKLLRARFLDARHARVISEG